MRITRKNEAKQIKRLLTIRKEDVFINFGFCYKDKIELTKLIKSFTKHHKDLYHHPIHLYHPKKAADLLCVVDEKKKEKKNK